MSADRQARAERLGPYLEVQLRLARRMSELTGAPLGDAAFRFTNFHRRLGFGIPDEAPSAEWNAYADGLDVRNDLADQVALTQAAFVAGRDEVLPLPGQMGFGCFAYDPPGPDGVVRIHFHNRDTDEVGGPLSAAKTSRRRAELAAMIRHILEEDPGARAIRGKSWLYNLEAYRRLFPPDYGASRAVAAGPLRLQGTSSWGQLIDSREAVRTEIRDALLASLGDLDPQAPWTAFPLRVLTTEASIESFAAFYRL
ncbi:MAG: hypothetical protein ACOY5Y_03110 [Pseudomonadota bacterium]